MKVKYLIIYIFFILFGLILTNCEEDYLKLTNPNQMTVESSWRNAQDVEAALTGTYALLQNQWWGGYWAPGEFFMTLEVMSDLTKTQNLFYPIGSGGHDSYNATSRMYTTKYFWQEFYRMIFAANQVIENTSKVPTLSESQANSYIAEAKFLRAYAHFQLLNLYGNIILVTEVPPTADDFYKKQSSSDTVYAQIEDDLNFAKQHLPNSYSQEWLGRATKGAAISYLGKVYLYQKKWAQAAQEFTTVTDMGYALVDDMHSLFTGKNEHSPESIFEINYTANRPSGRIESQSLVPNFNDWLGIYPSQHLKELFKNDTTVTGEPSKRTFASIVFNHPESHIWYFGDSTFADYYGEDDEKIYYKKYNYYNDEEDAHWYASVGTNYIMMRYADVLLMLAEALNEQGNTTQAIEYVNQIRSRAGSTPIPNSMSQTELREHIREVERPLELCNETQRFFDLVRWYKDDSGVKAALERNTAPNSDQFNEGIDEIWPIPITEIQSNPEIEQNPGY